MQIVADFTWVLSVSPDVVSQTFQLNDADGNVVTHQVLGATVNTLSVPVDFGKTYMATLTAANAFLSSVPVTLSFATRAAPAAPEAPTALVEADNVTA